MCRTRAALPPERCPPTWSVSYAQKVRLFHYSGALPIFPAEMQPGASDLWPTPAPCPSLAQVTGHICNSSQVQRWSCSVGWSPPGRWSPVREQGPECRPLSRPSVCQVPPEAGTEWRGLGSHSGWGFPLALRGTLWGPTCLGQPDILDLLKTTWALGSGSPGLSPPWVP